jgi:hypothetical protein
MPQALRCLIIGENPGDSDSEYFYSPPANYTHDRVRVRQALLGGLHGQGLIPNPMLEGFREGGFLFDHAIRCALPKTRVQKERRAAIRYQSTCAEDPSHLLDAINRAPIVWVMGHIASNAVANVTNDFPKQRRQIAKAPYPGELLQGSKFFLSEYFTRWNQAEMQRICEAFVRFARVRKVFN